jgi:hypothetical protein
MDYVELPIVDGTEYYFRGTFYVLMWELPLMDDSIDVINSDEEIPLIVILMDNEFNFIAVDKDLFYEEAKEILDNPSQQHLF